MITARTRVFAILGDPVNHSLSPHIHNAAFRAAGLDAVYVAIPCVASDLPGVMRSLARTGGGGNVTVPHKLVAAQSGIATEDVARLGVANMFWGDGDQVRVGNTDVPGLLALLDSIGVPPGAAWCIVGTGGSARAAVGAALQRGARIAVRSRDTTRAAEFANWARSLGATIVDGNECQVIINATPLGLRDGDPLPIDPGPMPVASYVADLTYRADGPTALVSEALSRGLAAADGREMLLIQAAAAWRYWFPGVEVPVGAMRDAMAGRVA